MHVADREWRDLLAKGKIQIAGINAATGAAVSLPAAVAAVSQFRFYTNEVVLPGDGGLRLLVEKVEQCLGQSKRRPSREKPFWEQAREVAFRWLDDEGCPEPGDGRQAELECYVEEWLSLRGHRAGEATIRRHVASWIAERRAALGLRPA
jgi:hypothetical protein